MKYWQRGKDWGMKDKSQKFISELASARQFTNVFNQYSFEVADNEVRRNNLNLYLSQMSRLNPKVLLVGEAPGYHGCRLTGVPFTSEYILIKHESVFGKKLGYRKTAEVSGLKKEQTATIIWETLNNHNFVPLMWNAFPFHPHENGNPQKNRTPSKEELEYGLVFLKQIINIFDIEKVVAIGKKSEASLNKLNIPCSVIRHPAKGGKPEFVRGIGEILAGRQYFI
jgi:uracil-DNA glycosylase